MLGFFLWVSFENTCGRIRLIVLGAKEYCKTNGCGLNDTGANSDDGVDSLVTASRSLLVISELLVCLVREVGALGKVTGPWILIPTNVYNRD
jgi:hypothetical protein